LSLLIGFEVEIWRGVAHVWGVRFGPILLGALLAALAPGAGCKKTAAPGPEPPAPPPEQQLYLSHAQPKLPTIRLWLGSEELEAEMARSLTEIATGMMFRTNMTDREGMLFLFASARPRSFYMRNCVVPLSAAYIDSAGIIDEIVDLNPGVEQAVPSRSDQIKYVLEVPQGWFARHHITAGVAITTPKGPLKDLRGVVE
jgi:uncharacterized protein